VKIWLFNPYGPIPSEGWRDYRFSMLGKVLAKNGHTVVWWTANFSHHFKQFRSDGWVDVNVTPGFMIRLVPTVGYKRNISFKRLAFESLYSIRAFGRAKLEDAPDCIIGVDPSQIVGLMCAKLAKRDKRITLILDVFDLWPELFALAFPSFLRPIAPYALLPFTWMRKHNLNSAHGIATLCDAYLAMARSVAEEVCEQSSATFYNGIDVTEFRAGLPSDTEKATLTARLGKRNGDIWAVHAGTLGNNYDVATLLQTAARLEEKRSRVRIILIGDGPLRRGVEEFISSRQPTNLMYFKSVAHRELIKIYGICDIGICAYAPGSNVGMPDKSYDYMAAGLPIVNSLSGELETHLKRQEMGLQYTAGNASSLETALTALANDSGGRSAMSTSSFKAANQFDRGLQYERYVQFVQRVAEGNHNS
jgi:glycosyltransferase involved in cell wall biosynthesis